MNAHTIPFLIKGPSFAGGRPCARQLDGFRDALADPDALAFFDYWLSRCGEAGLPAKAEIDPCELPGLLHAIYIEEWDGQRQQSRIRLAGEFYREVNGFNVQGLAVDDYAEGATQDLWKECDKLNFFELCPTLCAYDLGRDKRPVRFLNDLTLPVRAAADSVVAFGYTWPFES